MSKHTKDVSSPAREVNQTVNSSSNNVQHYQRLMSASKIKHADKKAV